MNAINGQMEKNGSATNRTWNEKRASLNGSSQPVPYALNESIKICVNRLTPNRSHHRIRVTGLVGKIHFEASANNNVTRKTNGKEWVRPRCEKISSVLSSQK